MQSLQQYLRASASQGRTITRVGPFLVTINEGTEHPFLNYAIPDDGAAPTAAEVTALIEAFRTRGRVPRLEYLEPTAPDALAALAASGFAVEGRLQAMTATRAVAVPLAAGHDIVVPATDAERTAMLAVQNVAYGAPPEVDRAQLARSRELETAGGIVLAVRAPGGAIVGGGATTAPDGSGFTEVAGIAVAAAHRRRGLATALTAELTRRAFGAGVRVAFLTPGDDGAARVYARAGFEATGRMLHVRLA